jgi:tetratricopeptide (TPR) repeat protein
MPAEEAYAEAGKAVQKALALNKFEPRAHKVSAYIHLFYKWDWEAAISEYRKAVQYGLPEQNEFITYLDIFLNKDYDRAIRVSKEMLEADPLHVESYWQVGICYYFAAGFEEALEYFDKALELDPNYSDGHHWRGLVLGYLGKYEEAVSSIEKALEITKGEGLAALDMTAVEILMGKKEEALREIKAYEFIDAGDAARLYTMLGMADEAVHWLEKGYKERSVMMVTIKHSWVWDPIRNHPGFIEIYNKMNF